MSLIDKALKFVRKIPFAKSALNRLATNVACRSTSPRPTGFSLWSHVEKQPTMESPGPVGEYTTWPMLIDRRFSARHLPPADPDYVDSLPKDAPYNLHSERQGDVTELFRRHGDIEKDRSSILFMFFAQWFTDSVLRINPLDRRKNTSNHNIDLCQIYGLTEETTRILRMSEEGDNRGKLRHQIIDGEEYLDYLGERNGIDNWAVKSCYEKLPYIGRTLEIIMTGFDDERWDKLYATGLERGNSSVGYVAISTLFLREHNRICGELTTANPDWDDERTFQTARMINIVLLMKFIIGDYINHIAGKKIFHLETGFAENKSWYRTPWIALEFDLLYRWHGLVPEDITFHGVSHSHRDYRVNNALFESIGVSEVISASSAQRAGRISLGNVPEFLLGAEYATVKMGRDFRLAPYNEYRKRFGLKRLKSFKSLVDNEALRDRLETLYGGNIDSVEFIVGIFAQRRDGDELFGDLLYKMVASDALTQIYTNPLLAPNVYNEETLSATGLAIIEGTESIRDFVLRNTSDGSPEVSFGDT